MTPKDMSLLELIRDLERYKLECEGGHMESCAPFIELKRRIVDADPNDLVEDGWMEVFSGEKVWFLDPKPEHLSIEDISESLSKKCRYNGHCAGFYTVAEHSCHISDYIMATTGDVTLAFCGLMHDAAEPYVGDAVRPLKRKLINFAEIERKFDLAICAKWGLPEPWPKIVKDCDSRILVDERRALMTRGLLRGNTWATDSLEPLRVMIGCWYPDIAKAEFMERFERLATMRLPRLSHAG